MRDYGVDVNEIVDTNLLNKKDVFSSDFHTDSIWCLESPSSFD